MQCGNAPAGIGTCIREQRKVNVTDVTASGYIQYHFHPKRYIHLCRNWCIHFVIQASGFIDTFRCIIPEIKRIHQMQPHQEKNPTSNDRMQPIICIRIIIYVHTSGCIEYRHITVDTSESGCKNQRNASGLSGCIGGCNYPTYSPGLIWLTFELVLENCWLP